MSSPSLLRLQQCFTDVLDGIDSLSTSQLYGAIVGLTVVICGASLALSDLPEVPTLVVPAATKNKSSLAETHREPRWHIFGWVNAGVMIVFASSLFHFCFHADKQDSNVLLTYFFLWCTLLCYFFGFFGVSFVHDTLEEDVTAPVNSRSLHPPAHSTPVCSDKLATNAPAKTKGKSSVLSDDVKSLSDDEIVQLVLTNQLKDHELEKRLDCFRAVTVRRKVVNAKLARLPNHDSNTLAELPSSHDLDYRRVHGANCEIVVGYVPLPVGIIGPLTINQESFYIPMATTEGCLVASTNRGAKAITAGGGAYPTIVKDGITRAPCVRLPTARDAAELMIWCQQEENFLQLKAAFESTTSFGKLRACQPTIAGRNVYLRLVCFSGDAMGMNMVSKGSLAVIEYLKERFPELALVALSGNVCTDKKAAATNWLHGRGKSVVVEASIPAAVVRTTLKTTVDDIVSTNLHKNLIGSAMAGVVGGGFNAHAANVVTAVYLATGQDPAQNVESSNCITLLEKTDAGDLWISCTMPSIEVGTVGGGTTLPAQAACLDVIGCKGGGGEPGANAQQLAKCVASAVMAGELSLLAALAANTLVQAHMKHNRKKK